MSTYTSPTFVCKLLEFVWVLRGVAVLLDYGRLPDHRELTGDAGVELREPVLGLFAVQLGQAFFKVLGLVGGSPGRATGLRHRSEGWASMGKGGRPGVRRAQPTISEGRQASVSLDHQAVSATLRRERNAGGTCHPNRGICQTNGVLTMILKRRQEVTFATSATNSHTPNGREQCERIQTVHN